MQNHEDKLWNRNFLILFIINVINGIAFSLATPMVSKFAIFLGATLSYAGVITGAFSAAALLIRPFAGAASDRLDKKKLMLLSAIGIALANFLAAIAPNADALMVIRAFHGVLFGLSGTTAMALGTQYIPKKRIGEGVGFLGMSLTLGNAVGPAAGIAIADAYGIRAAFLVTAVAMVAAVLMMFLIPKQPAPETKGSKIQFRDLIAPEVLPYAFFGIILMMTAGAITAFLVLLGEERGIPGVGLFFTLNAIIMVASRPLAGKLVDRVGIVKTMIPAFLCAAITMVLFAVSHSLIPVLLAALFHSFGYGMSHPALQAASINRMGVSKSGVATSTYYIGADLGISLGPIVGAMLATANGYGFMFWVLAALQVVGLGMFLVYAKFEKHVV